MSDEAIIEHIWCCIRRITVSLITSLVLYLTTVIGSLITVRF